MTTNGHSTQRDLPRTRETPRQPLNLKYMNIDVVWVENGSKNVNTP